VYSTVSAVKENINLRILLGDFSINRFAYTLLSLFISRTKEYSAVDERYYIGYKLHLLTNEHSVFQDMQITPANVHDINFLKNFEPESHSMGKTILGDRGDISQKVQTDLFTQCEINLSVPYRLNQKNTEPLNKEYGRKRRRIEVQFVQLCDQFRLKLNLAKSYIGFLTRIISKLAAIAVLQTINLKNGRPLNQIKHAWS
jgi:Transposase DDE domain